MLDDTFILGREHGAGLREQGELRSTLSLDHVAAHLWSHIRPPCQKHVLVLTSAHRQQSLREEMSQLPETFRRHSAFSKAGDGYLRRSGEKGGRRQACLRRVTSVRLEDN